MDTPSLKENTLLESVTNKLEAIANGIINQTESIERRLNGNYWADECKEKSSPLWLLNRLQIVLEVLESSNKNLTHILDTLI